MTVEEYFDHLMKIGMGWIGWTEEQTLDASMAAIDLAREGRIDMLQAIFGSGDKPPAPETPPETPPPGPTLGLPAPVPVSDRLKTMFRFLKSGPRGGMGR